MTKGVVLWREFFPLLFLALAAQAFKNHDVATHFIGYRNGMAVSTTALFSTKHKGSAGDSSPSFPTTQDPSSSSSSSSRTSLLWLRTSLRLTDNEALSRAAALGPDGMTVLYTWQHGPRTSAPQTPSAVFEAAAAHHLDQSLRSLGNHLKVLVVFNNDTDTTATNTTTTTNPAIAAVCDVISKLQPDSLVVDASSSETYHEALSLQETLVSSSSNHTPTAMPTIVEIISDDGSLFPFSMVPSALGRSRAGGRILRWSTYLSSLMSSSSNSNISGHQRQPAIALPRAAPATLPPPPLLEEMQQHTIFKNNSCCLPDPGSAGAWATNLLARWGPVTESEAVKLAKVAGRRLANNNNNHDSKSATTQLGNNRGASNISSSTRLSPYLRWGMISPRQAYHFGVRRRDLLWRDWSHMCYRQVTRLRQGQAVLSFLEQQRRSIINSTRSSATTNTTEKSLGALFTAWCRGATGAPMVDAGMRQLWHEGWMPRHVRLLCASCLVEGLGVDWRHGRDWFATTLIDHDPAINEMMWQNAGLCGIDLFYKSLAWESLPSKGSEEEYVKHWLSQEIAWDPSLLKQPSAQVAGSYNELVEVAASRRKEFQRNGLFRAAANVANSGVRVVWTESSSSNDGANGDVWGVGRVPIHELEANTK